MKQSFEQISDDIENIVGTRPSLMTEERVQEALPHDDSDEDEVRVNISQRSKYGKMVVFKESTPHISLGPDWCCFVPAFLAFSAATYFVIALVFDSSKNYTFRLITVLVCVGQPLAYLLTALTNPGIITESFPGPAERTRECTKCDLAVPRHARHCNDCGVCVGHYDHHCPWTSKCIGGGNIYQFYVFLGMTPVYMIYMTIAFVVCMSNNLTNIQHIQKH